MSRALGSACNAWKVSSHFQVYFNQEYVYLDIICHSISISIQLNIVFFEVACMMRGLPR